MGRGGLETTLMNYYRHIDRSKVQFDFLVHRAFEADYDREILALGGKIFHVSRLIPWSGAYKKELKRFFEKHPEYKIVHVHQDCLSSVALRCAEECGIPVRIAHSHNSNQDRNLKYLIKRHYMKEIPNFATDLFACGKDAGDWMFAGHSYRLLRNAIQIQEYTFSQNTANRIKNELNLTHHVVIGHVGRFHPQKNHAFLIDIFHECAKRNAEVRLLLVGDGEGKKAILDKVQALGLQDKVVFTGVRTDVNELMQAMDVFVFPSLYEGLGIVAVEAQAAGLPCVISENVPDECVVTTGLVTAKKLSDTPQEWAQHILKRIHCPRTDHTCEIAAAGYDIVTAAKQLEKFYVQKYEENQ